MSYSHITVARINKDTTDYIERFTNRATTQTEEAEQLFAKGTKVIRWDARQ
jgi:hypothetical protein